MSKEALTQVAEKFVKKLQDLNDAEGRPYKFTFELGTKYARIMHVFHSQRSVLAFVDADGVVRRANSYKAKGRVVGTVDTLEYRPGYGFRSTPAASMDMLVGFADGKY